MSNLDQTGNPLLSPGALKNAMRDPCVVTQDPETGLWDVPLEENCDGNKRVAGSNKMKTNKKKGNKMKTMKKKGNKRKTMKKKGNNMYVSPYSKNHKAK